MAEGGGVQAGNEREGAAVQEIGESVRVKITNNLRSPCFNILVFP